jgi:hypothetical protein
MNVYISSSLKRPTCIAKKLKREVFPQGILNMHMKSAEQDKKNLQVIQPLWPILKSFARSPLLVHGPPKTWQIQFARTFCKYLQNSGIFFFSEHIFFLALAVRPVFFKADQLSRFEKISKFAYVYSNYTVWALANYSCVTKTYVRTRAQLL